MLPEEVYKRRHFGTPESIMLIVVNYIVLSVSIQIFANCQKINSFFWVVVGLLAAYNAYSIYKDREEYTRVRIIAYVISVAGLLLLFFAFRSQPHHC